MMQGWLCSDRHGMRSGDATCVTACLAPVCSCCSAGVLPCGQLCRGGQPSHLQAPARAAGHGGHAGELGLAGVVGPTGCAGLR